MRLLLPVSLGLVIFSTACGGDDGGNNTGADEIAAVFPNQGFEDRSIKVLISGDGTNWDDTSTVDFGSAVTVTSVDVVGPQTIFANIDIGEISPLGKFDVTVTTGDDVTTLAQGFELIAPVTATAAGDFEQGAVSSITIVNNDLLNPFDTTQDPDTGDFTGVTVTSDAASGVALSVQSVTTDTIVLSALVDVTATNTGAITVTSGGVDSPVDAVAVTARTPQVITPGTPADFTVLAEGSLLEVTADKAGLLNLKLTTTDDQLAFSPGFALLPASGSFNDLIVVHQNFSPNAPTGDAALDNRVVAAGDKFFVVALELGIFGAPGYQATFNAEILDLPGTAVTDAEANETPATATALTGTLAEFDGVLTDVDDVDCFKVNVTAGQTIRVLTTDGDGTTDSVVRIFDNATDTDLTNPLVSTVEIDADFGDDVTTDTLTAGSKAICVSVSTFVSDITNGPYKAVVVVE